MPKTTITTKNAPAAVGPYSQAVVANGFVFCSGQIPLTKDGVIVESVIKSQTRQALTNLKAVLEAAGSSLEKVVKTTVYLSNMENFTEFNKAYGDFFKDNPPARTAVESPHLPKGVMVEIDAIAAT